MAMLVAYSLIVRAYSAHQRPKGTTYFLRISSLFFTYYIVFKMPLNLNFEPYNEEILI